MLKDFLYISWSSGFHNVQICLFVEVCVAFLICILNLSGKQAVYAG